MAGRSCRDDARFGGHGFYVLDEPEAALSPSGSSRDLAHTQLVQTRSQFVIAHTLAHADGLPQTPDVSDGADAWSAFSLEDTEHYTVAKRFLKIRSNSSRDCSTRLYRYVSPSGFRSGVFAYSGFMISNSISQALFPPLFYRS